jgi:hypothetical protein
MIDDTNKNYRLIPVTNWNRYHDWPPIGGLRHLIFHSKKNGFDKVIKRIGRRCLIDERKFFEYIEERNAQNAQEKV